MDKQFIGQQGNYDVAGVCQKLIEEFLFIFMASGRIGFSLFVFSFACPHLGDHFLVFGVVIGRSSTPSIKHTHSIDEMDRQHGIVLFLQC